MEGRYPSSNRFQSFTDLHGELSTDASTGTPIAPASLSRYRRWLSRRDQSSTTRHPMNKPAAAPTRGKKATCNFDVGTIEADCRTFVALAERVPESWVLTISLLTLFSWREICSCSVLNELIVAASLAGSRIWVFSSQPCRHRVRLILQAVDLVGQLGGLLLQRGQDATTGRCPRLVDVGDVPGCQRIGKLLSFCGSGGAYLELEHPRT